MQGDGTGVLRVNPLSLISTIVDHTPKHRKRFRVNPLSLISTIVDLALGVTTFFVNPLSLISTIVDDPEGYAEYPESILFL